MSTILDLQNITTTVNVGTSEEKNILKNINLKNLPKQKKKLTIKRMRIKSDKEKKSEIANKSNLKNDFKQNK